jgi:hypothetical protein
MPTNLDSIIRELENERSRIDRAIQSLKGVGSAKSATKVSRRRGGNRRGHLSAGARARIAAAQRARWAKFRAKNKKKK